MKKPITVGDRLRAAIEAEFDLSEAEGLLLAKACSTADLLARVEAATVNVVVAMDPLPS